MALGQYRVPDEAESWLGKVFCLVWGVVWAPVLLADLNDRLWNEKLSSCSGIAQGLAVYFGFAIIMCYATGVGQHVEWVLAGMLFPAFLLQGLLYALRVRAGGASFCCSLVGWKRLLVEDGLSWLLPFLWMYALLCLALGVPVGCSLAAALAFLALYPLHMGLQALCQRMPWSDVRREWVEGVDVCMLLAGGLGMIVWSFRSVAIPAVLLW